MNIRLCLIVVLALGLSLVSAAQARLESSNLLLLTNANVPQSLELAKHYADVRKVPAERILPLDVPAGEDMTVAEYQANVVAPVRKYLQSDQGRGVQCLVLFYGLPLRVGASESNPTDRAELANLRRLIAELDKTTSPIADAMEEVAKPLGVKPVPGIGSSTTASRNRVEAAARGIEAAAAKLPVDQQRQVMGQLDGVRKKMSDIGWKALDTIFGVETSTNANADSIPSLKSRPHDPAARALVRRRVAAGNGAFMLYELAQEQIAWTNQDESDASLDSELSLVRMDEYPRYRWQRNALNYNGRDRRTRMLMTCRIDAPTFQIARDLVDSCVAVEETGLIGKAVIDARGIAPEPNGQPGSYGVFDQILRDTAGWLKRSTKIPTTLDDRAQVMGPRSASDVALYCGWYSLRNYVPSCTFNRGAVAYHVASWELLSLHDRNEKGWVPNLLKDNVAATLGAVSEPYLGSFPRPDEFFPLLLTGRLTLAEVYWSTCPMASWKITLIGDPLYRPYAKSPAVQTSDLSPQLADAIEKIEAARPPGR